MKCPVRQQLGWICQPSRRTHQPSRWTPHNSSRPRSLSSSSVVTNLIQAAVKNIIVIDEKRLLRNTQVLSRSALGCFYTQSPINQNIPRCLAAVWVEPLKCLQFQRWLYFKQNGDNLKAHLLQQVLFDIDFWSRRLIEYFFALHSTLVSSEHLF